MSDLRKLNLGPIFLVNVISGRGHLDSYARLYTRCLLELGLEVILVAAADGGVADYIGRTAAAHAGRFRFLSSAEILNSRSVSAERGDRAAKPLHVRARLVLAEEGLRGLTLRLGLVPLRILRRLARSILAHRHRAAILGWIKNWTVVGRGHGRIPFAREDDAVETAVTIVGRPPGLVLHLYLDLMQGSRRDVVTLDKPGRPPWAGILFHPRSERQLRGRGPEAYFQSKKLRGMLFLVPDAVGRYKRAVPACDVVLVPDVADDEGPGRLPALAQDMRRLAAGRTIVLQIGSIAPHKGIAALIDVISRADRAQFFFAIVGEVHWESFGADAPRLRAFYAAPPENVLVHEGYMADERDYNGVFAAADVIYAVYHGFDSSSNSLTKAAAFRRKILVAEGTLMGKRVMASRLGGAAPSGNPAGILAALTALAEKPLDDFNFSGYADAHSLEALKAVLAEALPRWCAAR